MTLRMAFLTLTLVAMVFATCTGCAGIYVNGSQTVGYAIGKAKATSTKTAKVGKDCGASDQDSRLVGARPRILEITSPYVEVIPAAPRVAPICDTAQEVVHKITVEGGNLGAGWFGVIGSFLMLYFAPFAPLL